MTLDYTQRNKIIRQRGYAFEKKIVESFLKSPNWNAKRLGGTTTKLPDVVATNYKDSIMLSIECKSTARSQVSIERTQIDRCITMLENQPYKHKFVVFAFKFKRNPDKLLPLKYYIIGYSLRIGDIDRYTMHNEGAPYIKRHGHLLTLDDQPTPKFIESKPERLGLTLALVT